MEIKGNHSNGFSLNSWCCSQLCTWKKNDTNDWVQILSSYSPVHTWTASMQSWGDCRIITSRKYKKIVAATLILTLGGGGVFQTLSMIWEALWLKHIEAPTFQKFPGPISVLDLSTAEFEHWELLLKWYRYIILHSEERCIRYWTYND